MNIFGIGYLTVILKYFFASLLLDYFCSKPSLKQFMTFDYPHYRVCLNFVI
jgi:hypothetical protein